MRNLGRPDTSADPVGALRSALASPWPQLRATAARIVRRATRRAKTVGEAAERLGISRRGFERLREQFPEEFRVEKKS